MNWIISANSKYYDHKKSFEDYDYIDWKQVGNFNIGDLVYIYTTRPDSKLSFITRVEKTDLSFNEIRDDKKYWKDMSKYKESKLRKFSRLKLIKKVDDYDINLEKLLQNGLNGAPQGPVKIRHELQKYLDSVFNNNIKVDDTLDSLNVYLEGEQQQALITKYERNPEARKECLDYYGHNCKVCGFNFRDTYGEIGKDYIHVHHLVPISKIKETYIINPISDLIPVCPNCHAMLHKKKANKEYLTVEELSLIVKKRRSQ